MGYVWLNIFICIISKFWLLFIDEHFISCYIYLSDILFLYGYDNVHTVIDETSTAVSGSNVMIFSGSTKIDL